MPFDSLSNIRMDDGFSTIISLNNLPGIQLFEKDVMPPGYNMGSAIDTTTMRNLAYRTQSPRHLKSLTKMTSSVAYATSALTLLWAQLGVKQMITVTFPDGSSIRFWGWMEEFLPAAHKEGTQPTAVLTIEASMTDEDGTETPPVYSMGAALNSEGFESNS